MEEESRRIQAFELDDDDDEDELDSEYGEAVVPLTGQGRILSPLDVARESRALYPLYIGGTLFLLVLILAASSGSKKEQAFQCPESSKEDWRDLLQRVERWSLDERCRPDAEGCYCMHPLRPFYPQDPPNWAEGWQTAYKHNQQLIENVTTTPLDVVLMGDSITEHWMGVSLGVPSQTYQHNERVFHKLFDKENDEYAELQGLALGISGDRCPQLLYRVLNGNMTLPAHVYWMLIGTNDYISSHCNTDSIVAGNIKIVHELQKKSPDTTIVINSLLPVGSSKGVFYREDYLAMNQRLECFAQQTDGVEFFNATRFFIKDGVDGNFLDMKMLPDGLHPQVPGSRVWGQAIVDRVLEIKRERGLD